MRYDAAARLVQVYEDPSSLQYLTCYAYDALDDLLAVKQKGITTGVSCASPPETRTFAYDALKRLTDATNPESGTAHYVYDGNGNLTSRTDGNSVVSTFQYDKLNRIATKRYSAGSPGDIVLCYDGDTAATHSVTPDWSCAGAPSTGSNLKGRTTMVSNPASITRYSNYDAWGRILNSQQSTLSVDYPFIYTYDAAGDLLTEKYPITGRVVTDSYDAIGRVLTVTGTLGAATNYATVSAYAAQGGIQQLALGSLVEETCFNARLQPVTVRQLVGPAGTVCGTGGADVLRLGYDYGSGNNNGNVASQTIAYGSATSFSQTYTYDTVNRLQTMGETGPGTAVAQTYVYDYAGNRWVNPNSGFLLSAFTPIAGSVYDSLNRMNTNGAAYNLGGNQTQIGGFAFGYDGENRLTSSTISSATSGYGYDGEGRRVTKQSGGATTVFVYDAAGSLAQESVSGTPPPASPCTTCYLMADTLGSTRLMVGTSENVLEKHDYLPFGEELPSGVDGRDTSWGGPDPRQKFTSKERDAESGLDYFGARYFSGAQARFTSPDWSATPQPVPYADLRDPQTLNLYGYVRNHPLNLADPDGHCCWDYMVQWADAHPRTMLAGKATLNVAVASVKIAEAAGGAVAAPATGGLTLAVTVYQGIGAAGNLAAAGSQIVGAITGDVKSGETGAKVASAATTITGIATLVATHGDLDKAARAATLENAVTTVVGAAGLFKGTVAEVATKASDAAQTAVDTSKAIKPPSHPNSCGSDQTCK